MGGGRGKLPPFDPKDTSISSSVAGTLWFQYCALANRSRPALSPSTMNPSIPAILYASSSSASKLSFLFRCRLAFLGSSSSHNRPALSSSSSDHASLLSAAKSTSSQISPSRGSSPMIFSHVSCLFSDGLTSFSRSSTRDFWSGWSDSSRKRFRISGVSFAVVEGNSSKRERRASASSSRL